MPCKNSPHEPTADGDAEAEAVPTLTDGKVVATVHDSGPLVPRQSDPRNWPDPDQPVVWRASFTQWPGGGDPVLLLRCSGTPCARGNDRITLPQIDAWYCRSLGLVAYERGDTGAPRIDAVSGHLAPNELRIQVADHAWMTPVLDPGADGTAALARGRCRLVVYFTGPRAMPADPPTFMQIEAALLTGRALVGEIALTGDQSAAAGENAAP